MCALFGYLDCGKRVPMRTLQKMVQALANASEVRGHHASGIAYNHNGRLSIYKRPKPAHRLRFRIPDETAAVMGHTRYTTQGSQKRNCNNHPFRGNAGTEFALAHNGVLYNDTELRLRHNRAESTPETWKHPGPPKRDSDTSEENTQKLIERELQQHFRDIIRQFNPDHPCWPSMLTGFFKMYLEQHHFTCPNEHDSMLAHLQQFMYLNPDRFDYRKHLEALFHELWHSA